MPEQISLSEAARRLGCSKQAMSLWAAQDEDFPPVVHRGRALAVEWPVIEAWYRARQRDVAAVATWRAHDREFRRVRAALWTRARWLFSPEDLSMILSECTTPDCLRRLSRRLGLGKL